MLKDALRRSMLSAPMAPSLLKPQLPTEMPSVEGTVTDETKEWGALRAIPGVAVMFGFWSVVFPAGAWAFLIAAYYIWSTALGLLQMDHPGSSNVASGLLNRVGATLLIIFALAFLIGSLVFLVRLSASRGPWRR
jgi:hypothetical protein